MRRNVLPVSLLLVFGHAASMADDGPKKDDSPLSKKLVGTWKLVSAKYGGNDFTFPEGMTVLKHVTPEGFMTVTLDKDGKVLRASGGSHQFEGETYKETPEYSTSDDFGSIKGKVQSFQCKIEGKKWFHEGRLSNDLLVEEVYERVETK